MQFNHSNENILKYRENCFLNCNDFESIHLLQSLVTVKLIDLHAQRVCLFAITCIQSTTFELFTN